MGLIGRRRRRRGDLGFSLIEALIAAALLLVVVLGFVPLFVRSSISNSEGRESTRAANFARSRAEQLYELPFNHPSLDVDGTATEIVDYYLHSTETWSTDAGSDPLDVWKRTTTVRQYHINALSDGQLQASEALPGGSDPAQVHLKEIEVAIESERGSNILGPPKSITVRVLKAK